MNLRNFTLGTLLIAFLLASTYVQWAAHQKLPDASSFGLQMTGGGKPAPDFELPLLDGPRVSLQDFRGRFVLLDFWATWCSPCRKSMPMLEELQNEHAEELVLLAVNMNESEETVRQFLEREGLDVTVLMDRDGAVGRAYGVVGLPTQVLIDPEGRTAFRLVGFNPMMIPSIKQVMARHREAD